MSSRYVSGPPSAIRKSRLDGKPSLLPVMRRLGSSDRVSTEAPRPSTSTTFRSSSADPQVRGTFGGGRPSREISATKSSINRTSRAQTPESRYGQSLVTPLRSTQYRPTSTPLFQRTPDDKSGHRWDICLERALAFVTVKEQRPIASAAWQRGEYARVCAALAAEGASGAALVRPLTIARFVDIVSNLLTPILNDVKLSTDNYVTKLPHLAKRLLYPSPLSKSWLRTVNTLHAFPHALALVGYLLDLAAHLQLPVSDETLYVRKDPAALLQQEYLRNCWFRFQHPDVRFDDLNEEYIQNLKNLLGNDEEKLVELQQDIRKYEAHLQDEEVLAARADEARRAERRDALAASVRAVRGARRGADAELAVQRALRADRADELRALDADIERTSAELEQLRLEVERQPLSLEERNQLLDHVDYSTRVHDSKRALTKQLAKMLQGKETELAQWQKRTLDCCVEYKQGLVHLAGRLPALASLAIDEKELMGADCALHMARAVEVLREEGDVLAAKKAELQRTRSALGRRKALLLEETRAKIAEMKTEVRRQQEALDVDVAKEAGEGAAWSREEQEVRERLARLGAQLAENARVDAELHLWEKKETAWRLKLAEMQKYIESQKVYAQQKLVVARQRRLKLVGDTLALWNNKLEDK